MEDDSSVKLQKHTFIELPVFALLLLREGLDPNHLRIRVVLLPLGYLQKGRPDISHREVRGNLETEREIRLTQEVMVICVRSHDVFHVSELLDSSLCLVTVWCRGDDPNVTRRELNGGRPAPHWKEPEESGKGPREGNQIRGDLRR